MLQITKELRDLIVSVLGMVKSDNVNFEMTLKGLVSTLSDLKEEDEKKTLDEVLEEKVEAK
jgi:hypothetical protein